MTRLSITLFISRCLFSQSSARRCKSYMPIYPECILIPTSNHPLFLTVHPPNGRLHRQNCTSGALEPNLHKSLSI